MSLIRSPYFIHLTGPIASGKSTLLELFKTKLGAATLDADEIAKKVRLSDETVRQSIYQTFGTLETEALRYIIARDPARKKQLEDLMHPAIRAQTLAWAISLCTKEDAPKFAVYESALLLPSDHPLHLYFKDYISVETPEIMRFHRLKTKYPERTGVSQLLLAKQSSEDARKRYATLVILNSNRQQDLLESFRTLTEILESRRQLS